MNSLRIEQSAEPANCEGNLARCSAAKAQDESLAGVAEVETGKGQRESFWRTARAGNFFIAVLRLQR